METLRTIAQLLCESPVYRLDVISHARCARRFHATVRTQTIVRLLGLLGCGTPEQILLSRRRGAAAVPYFSLLPTQPGS